MLPATKAPLWALGLLAIVASHLVVAQSPTSSNVKFSTVTECPPTTVYAPFAYSACQNCPVATITNLTQTITVLPDKVKGVQDSCLVPFRDWVFEPVKTLTCYPGAASGAAAGGQPIGGTPNVERWSVGCQQTVTFSTYIADPTCITLEGGSTINVPYAPTVITYYSTQYSSGVTSTFRTQIQETFRTQQVVGAQSSFSPQITNSIGRAVPSPASAAATTQPIPTDSLAAFRLYLSTSDAKLNAIPVGEDQSGNVAVGGPVTGIVISINPAGNLLDATGNLIFFDPLTASVSRRRKRQDVSATAPSLNQTESRLKFGTSPPSGSVVARFSLNGITLRVVSDQGVTFGFYVCTESPVSQPLLVSRGGQPPTGCFSFDLVTQPDPLGTPSASNTTITPSTTSDTSSSANLSTSSDTSTSVPTLTSSTDPTTGPTTGSTTTPTSTSSTTASSTPASTDLVALATSIIEARSLQSFCSDFLGYTTPVTTETTGAATTVSETTTVASGESTTSTTELSTETSTVPVTTTTSTSTPIVSFTVTSTTTTAVTTRVTLVPRAAVLPRGPAPPIVTPTPLTTFAPSILSSACSLEATSVSVTSTTTLTTTGTVTDSSTSFTVSNTVIVTISTTETTTFSTDTSTVLTTEPTISTTSTDLFTATTTITIATNAPTNAPTYLQLDPIINPGSEYALSDDANHLTDNYYRQSQREVFAVTSAGKLYSFTNNAYYYPEAGLSGKLFWSTNINQGSNNFFTTVNVSNGKTQAFLRNPLTGNAYQFCARTLASGDGNTNAGLHIYFFSELAVLPANCISTRLFLVPV